MNTPDESRHRRPGYNPRTGAYHLYHDWDAESTIVETVLCSVAAITNLDPIDLDSPNETLDTDALEALFRPLDNGRGRESGYVSFPLNECAVVVHADGEVEVHPPFVGTPRLFGDLGRDDG